MVNNLTKPVAGRDGVDFVAVVDQAIVLLRQRGRLTYRTLQRQCTVDRLPRRIERLGYDGHLEPVAVPVVGEIVKATRLGAPQRCGAAPVQGPVETVWQHALLYGLLVTVRTWLKRLVRTMIGFSGSIQMHDMGLGSFTNWYACSLPVSPYAVQI